MVENMILNRNIFKEKRITKNLSLEDISSKLEIKEDELRKIEEFEKVIDYKNIEKAKEVLDISDQEIKEYFDNWYKIKSNESKSFRRNISLILSSFIYALCFIPLFCSGWFSRVDNSKYFFVYIIIGFVSLFGSYTSFVASKGKISNKKYFILLLILTIVFILILIMYLVLTVIVCNNIRHSIY